MAEPVFNTPARQRIGGSVRETEALRHDLLSVHGQHRTAIPIRSMLEAINAVPVILDDETTEALVTWVIDTNPISGLPGNPDDGMIGSDFALAQFEGAQTLIQNASDRNMLVEFLWNITMHRTRIPGSGGGQDKVHIHVIHIADDEDQGDIPGQCGEISTSSVTGDPSFTKGNACSAGRFGYRLRAGDGFAVRIELHNNQVDTYETIENGSSFSIKEVDSYPPLSYLSE